MQWQLGKPSRFPSAQTWFPRTAHTSGSPEVTLEPTGSAGHMPREPESPLGGEGDTCTPDLSFVEPPAASGNGHGLLRSQSGISSHLRANKRTLMLGPLAGRALLSQSGCMPELGDLAWTCTCPLSRLLAGSSYSFPVNPDPVRSDEAKTQPGRGIAIMLKSQ